MTMSVCHDFSGQDPIDRRLNNSGMALPPEAADRVAAIAGVMGSLAGKGRSAPKTFYTAVGVDRLPPE